MNDAPVQPRGKVCILTSVHIPFDGRIFHRQAKSLVQAGYDVVLIAPHDAAETVDGVRMVPLPESGNRLERMTLGLWRLWRLAVKERADVYHFHDPELMLVGLLLKLRGKKVIWDVHEHYPNSILDKFWISKGLRRFVSTSFDVFERLVVRCFDYVIYTTPLVGARYEDLKVRCGRIENYPSVKPSQVLARAPEKRIMYLGAMSRIRGLIELIDAFALVAPRCPGWEFWLVGACRPAAFEDALRARAAQRQVATQVKFVPWVPYDRKEHLLSKAAIGVVTYLPYRNNTSCLPNKLFEYMLAEIPVIASDFPLYREVVQPSQCGLLVDPTRPQAIAEALEHLVEHPEQARRMGANGRRAVRDEYNWETQSAKLLHIYAAVLGGNGEITDVESTADRWSQAQLHEDGATLFCDAPDAGARTGDCTHGSAL